MSHLCHAVGCGKKIPPKLLFCLPHWQKLSASQQAMIWLVYKPGQEIVKNPSGIYLVAQASVVADVARKEGKWSSEQCVDHVMQALRKQVERGTVSIEDLERIGRYEPIFKQFAATLREGSESDEHVGEIGRPGSHSDEWE